MRSFILAVSLVTSVASAHAGDTLPSVELANRVSAFKHSLTYEGNGEFNCMPAQCKRQLHKFGLTWSLVKIGSR